MSAKKEKAAGGIKNSGSPHSYMFVETSLLKPYAKNAKKHPVWHVNQIRTSIETFGWMNPILITEEYEIISGHGRYAAAMKMGLKHVPVIIISNLSEAQVRAYRLADNQLNLNTGYDQELLRVDLQELYELEPEFELEVIGFSTAALDKMIDGEDPAGDDKADEVPAVQDAIITKLGDRWILGVHVLLCGDALLPSNYKNLLNGETAHAIFTDPPYNVPVSGHICGNGKIKHDEFAMASGEMSDEEFQKFLVAVIALLIEFSENGSLHYICMDWRGIYLLLAAARGQYKEHKNICIWNKSNGGMGSLYRSKHEFVPVFKNGSAAHTNNVSLGKHGRYRTNVWDYPGVNSFGGKGDLEMHPTVKPVAMVADAILDSTKRDEIVLDPFGGSGSTLIACEKTGRKARCMELEPKYCDVIIRRWQTLTCQDATHAETGKSFNQIAQEGRQDD